jgi:hypothetical protein
MGNRKRPLSAATVGLGLAGVLAVSGFGAQQPSSSAAGSWGKAITLPGSAGAPSAISCASPGNCGAVGGLGGFVYVASQARGKWGAPKVIPGTARTFRPSSSSGGIACFAAGDCVVVGSYRDTAGRIQAFIASQTHGTWGKLSWVSGLTRLDRGHHAGLGELSCPSAGNCTAAGSYTNAAGTGLPFVVSQVHGVWGSARPVPGLTGLPGQIPGSLPGFGPISCASAGNCAAAGTYKVSAGPGVNQVYVDDEVNGVWGTPMAVPGLAALNTGLFDNISSISCPSVGNCGAGGSYTESEGNADSFVVSETHGTWGPATEVTTSSPGFNGSDGDWITTMSCPSAGNCVAGGVDNVERDALSASLFIVTQTHGTWGKAIPLPGSDQLNQGDQAGFNQVSCSSAGNCGAVGYISVAYDYGFVYTQPFVASEAHGVWSKLSTVPGIKTLGLSDGQNSQATTISCTAPDRCTAGGYYQQANGDLHSFVASRS